MKSIKERKSNGLITFFTCVLAITAVINVLILINQNKISKSLYEIQKYYYELELKDQNLEIIISEHKLQKSIDEIFNLFSWKGLNERSSHTKLENIELASEFRSILIESLDNILLVENEEALKRWYHAINSLYFYYQLDKIDPSLNQMDDNTFNKIFLIHITEAWQNVFWVYFHLGLSPLAIYESLDPDSDSILGN